MVKRFNEKLTKKQKDIFRKKFQIFLQKRKRKQKLLTVFRDEGSEKAKVYLDLLLDKFVAKHRKKVFFRNYLFIKKTLNNYFVYFYKIKRLGLFKYKKKIDSYLFLNLGSVGYKGAAKLSDIALYDLGVSFAKKLLLKKVFVFKVKKYKVPDILGNYGYYKVCLINLILFTKLNKRLKSFIKGFLSVDDYVKFKYIYAIPRLAHNGCRLRKKRRK